MYSRFSLTDPVSDEGLQPHSLVDGNAGSMSTYTYPSTVLLPATPHSPPPQPWSPNERCDDAPRQIGDPMYFSIGQFAGKTIRMELHEIQKADLGRKYARVDRRPLDPPPVTHLRIFAVDDFAHDHNVERELDYDDVQANGLICTVDLFPVPQEYGSMTARSDIAGHSTSAPSGSGLVPSGSVSPNAYYDSRPSYIEDRAYTEYGRLQQNAHFSASSTKPSPKDPVHYVNGYPIMEVSRQTPALVGATFVQPATVDYQGRKAVVFVFADLAVKNEGTFILRYRVFDLFSKAPGSDSNNMMAEVYGGMFRVYSTKEFPGLPPSTELTKHLNRWGVRLNIRETERKKRKKSESDEGEDGDRT